MPGFSPNQRPAEVLLVEDDQTVPSIIRNSFADDLINLVWTGKGMDGLRIAREKDFDLILLDLGLPDFGGFALLQEFRMDPRWTQVPIIIITASNNADDKVKGFEFGAWDYITKPFEVKEVSARVRAALRIKFLQDELTAANEALEKARATAEMATRAKSNFLAQMSHEIRTPMNGVIAMSRLLLEGNLSAEQRDIGQTIQASADALLALINDILDFSKIEAGKIELENLEFDARTCIEETLDIVAPRAEEKRIELSCHIEDSVPDVVIGDMARLRQVLLNLVSNGLKFTLAGEVLVHLTAGKPSAVPADPKTSCCLHFSVRDTGIGIPAEKFNKLFQPFSQVESSVSREFGGTGLGLAISESLVKLMGGKMWVESALGQGSTFHFTILVQPGPSPKQPVIDPSLNGSRLLIVDDNITNRRILTLQARKWGIGSVDVASAREALEAFTRENFDFAILDMQMPEMDGLTLAAELKKRFPNRATPLILLTSMGLWADTPKEKLAPFYACLNKPVKPAQLLDVLTKAKAGVKISAQRDESRLSRVLAERYPLKLLLVDDNAINQKVGLRLFQQMGFKSDLAMSGAEAIKAVQEKSYDIVFMDIQMPEMDGYETTQRLRELEQRKAIAQLVIIAMTANAMQGDREKCLAAGMNDYIAKPVHPDTLQQLLERWGDRIKPLEPKPSPALPASQSSSSPVAAAPPEPVEKQLIDMNRLRMFSDGTDNCLRELIDLYLEQTEKQLAELKAAIQVRSCDTIRRIAHNAAGSSMTCGMLSLGALLREIERRALENNLAPMDKLCAGAMNDFREIRKVLNTEFPRSQSA